MEPTTRRPLIVTLGDPAGIGAECVARVLAERASAADVDRTDRTEPAAAANGRGAPADAHGRRALVLVGRLDAWQRACAVLGSVGVAVPEVEPIEMLAGEAVGAPAAGETALGRSRLVAALDKAASAAVPPASPPPRFLDVSTERPGDTLPAFGSATAGGGRIAAATLTVALAACQDGRAAGMVTAPINKTAMRLAEFGYTGHTTWLAAQTGCEVRMAFAGGGLFVVLASVHLPLAAVPGALSVERIAATIALADAGFAGVAPCASGGAGGRPRIAVCALNPHAGEGGLFGDEEAAIVAPAVRRAQARGIDAVGPLPADSLFSEARAGRYEVIVALYHDQGLIPIKLAAPHASVNLTLGLPFVRTSPDHGTAYDLAGTGQANPGSMRAALELAEHLAAD